MYFQSHLFSDLPTHSSKEQASSQTLWHTIAYAHICLCVWMRLFSFVSLYEEDVMSEILVYVIAHIQPLLLQSMPAMKTAQSAAPFLCLLWSLLLLLKTVCGNGSEVTCGHNKQHQLLCHLFFSTKTCTRTRKNLSSSSSIHPSHLNHVSV